MARVKIFNEQHEMFRATVRSFVEKEIMPHVEEWEAGGADAAVDLAAHGRARASSVSSTTRSTAAPAPTS